MSSQIIATFYLNDLDYYIEDELKIKSYIRYMDDGVLIHNDKNYLKYCCKKIEIFLRKYKLNLNSKTRIYSSNEEIEFLGFKFFIRNNRIIMKVVNKTKKNFKQKIIKYYDKYIKEMISYDEYRSIRDSYLGHLEHGCCGYLCYKYIK